MRTFLLNSFPEDYSKEPPTVLTRGYISRTKERNVIIEKSGSRCRLLLCTPKDGKEEVEYGLDLSRKDFDALWPSTGGNRLEKECWDVHMQHRDVRINRYRGKQSGLLTAEVFPPPAGKDSPFLPPSCFGEELSFDPRFSPESLCRRSYKNIKDLLSLSKPGQYPQIGTLPYRMEKGKPRILLVTTRSQGMWIYPKGQPMKGKTSQEVALQESYEEAGIKGLISGHPLIVSYKKNTGTYTMVLYPMEIKELLPEWPEEGERKRKFFALKEAEKKLKQPGLQEALRYFDYLRE